MYLHDVADQRVSIGVTIKHPHVDIVEMALGPRPVEETIINLKLNIRRHPRRLYRAKIGPYHLCCWINVCKIAIVTLV